MNFIVPCSQCDSPVQVTTKNCPQCGSTSIKRQIMRLATPVVGAITGLSVTSILAACYGVPCSSESSASEDDYRTCLAEYGRAPLCEEIVTNPEEHDLDGDGYCLEDDCNEEDATINAAGYDELGDGIDQNCDGVDGSIRAGTDAASVAEQDTVEADLPPYCYEVVSNPDDYDLDDDGYCLEQDCNEEDPDINVIAYDYPDDGIDQNCDGVDGYLSE